jgi:hypothetical protein
MTGYFAIFGWPVAAAIFFARFNLAVAISVTIVAGYLFLPLLPKIDLPVLPSIDKNSVPAFVALILAFTGAGAVVNHQRKSNGPRAEKIRLIPRNKLALLLLTTLLLCGIATSYLNGDPLRYGPRTVPGLTLYDGLSSAMTAGVMIIPFLLGYAFLARPEDHKSILIVMAIFGGIYSILALYEIRMSPQLNRSIYGFFPHSWVQHKRGGGWRPIVFLKHGLFVGIFLSMATYAALTIMNQAVDDWRTKAKWLALLTGGTLLLSSNLGATLILILFVPILFFVPSRGQMLFAATIAGLVFLYPMARGAGLVPVDSLISFAEKIDTDRADSLTFRFENEDVLLEKAFQRPGFGWGGWTRGRVFNDRGEITTITDGYWVIIFGDGGWVRYLSEMGLLCLPIVLLAYRQRRYELGPITTGLSLVLAINLIDLLPNAGLSPITWMISGALWGRLALGKIMVEAEEQNIAPRPVSSYTRQTELIDRHQRLRPKTRSRARPPTGQPT